MVSTLFNLLAGNIILIFKIFSLFKIYIKKIDRYVVLVLVILFNKMETDLPDSKFIVEIKQMLLYTVQIT